MRSGRIWNDRNQTNQVKFGDQINFYELICLVPIIPKTGILIWRVDSYLDEFSTELSEHSLTVESFLLLVVCSGDEDATFSSFFVVFFSLVVVGFSSDGLRSWGEEFII